MKSENQNKTIQKTTQNATPTPQEIKPKFEFGTIEISAILIVVFTAVTAYISQRIWHKRQKFRVAADDFLASFIPAIRILETKPFCDRDILRETFSNHEQAMFLFREHLRGRKRRRFKEDWAAYEQHYKERTDVPIYELIGRECFDPDRMADPAHHAEVEQFRRKQALDHINKLRTYAE